jgi:DNA-binding SARP family transcriptional activator
MATATNGATYTPHSAHTPSQSALEREAFRGFPYALLVLDGGGRILCANREATRLIEASGLREGGLTCCALLGCRRPGTVLASACLTELAVGGAKPLPEVRVDIATAEGPLAVWAATAPVDREEDRVVLQLRPGVAGDRRQRTTPHWMAGPTLRISCLGRTVVSSTEGQIAGAWLDQRTGQLLKYLVAERSRAVAVDEIGESIWPGADYAVGSNVRYYVHALRRKLEPLRGLREPSAFILAGSGSYRLRLEHVRVDADEFEAHVSGGLAAVKTDRLLAAAEIERGLALYQGDFLADLPYAEWAMPERHRLHDLACVGLGSLADLRLEQGALENAARCMERLAILQPYDEDVHRRLMELEIMQGRRSEAVRRYATLRSRIRRTFGHDPSFTPADLARPMLRL